MGLRAEEGNKKREKKKKGKTWDTCKPRLSVREPISEYQGHQKLQQLSTSRLAARVFGVFAVLSPKRASPPTLVSGDRAQCSRPTDIASRDPYARAHSPPWYGGAPSVWKLGEKNLSKRRLCGVLSVRVRMQEGERNEGEEINGYG